MNARIPDAAVTRRPIFSAVLGCALAALVAVQAAVAAPKGRIVGPDDSASPRQSQPHGLRSKAERVKVDHQALRALQAGDEIEVAIPGRGAYAVVVDSMQHHSDEVASLVGHVKGLREHGRVIITSGPDGSFGAIDTPDGTLRLVAAAGAQWSVDEAEEERQLPAPPPVNDAIPVDTGEIVPKAALLEKAASAAAPAMIDMMIVVTQGLATRLGSNLQARLNFLITRANQAYVDSNVYVTLRLVHTVVVNYPDNSDDITALAAITPFCTTSNGSCGGKAFNPAVFGQIESLRNQYGADMVSFLRNGNDFGGSGIAWVPTPSSSTAMYSTLQGCVSGCENVFIHEVGHNMGSFHDRATHAWQDGGVAAPSGADSSFGYAYCASGALTCNPNVPGGCSSAPECTASPSNFSDLMAYFMGSTHKLYRFSNPLQTNCRSTRTGSDGVNRRCGVPDNTSGPGVIGSADAAFTLNESAPIIAALKSTVVVPPPSPSVTQLITHYYQSILRRAPDAGGLAFWQSEASRMATLGANPNETFYAMAAFFFFSPEYLAFGRDNAGFVTDLYNTFFNRAPDAGGLSYWTGQIASGMPREVVLVGFMLSPEFVAYTQGIFGNAAARAEVNVVMDFYRGLLSRLPDNGGYNTWVGLFRTAQCSGSGAVLSQVEAISRAFATSSEYASRNRTNAQYVGDLYNAFLRRGGDLAGVQHWIGQLQARAMTREQVRQAFIATAEFRQRVQGVVAQGCLR